MNEANRAFRERLLDAEGFTPTLKERYHKELQAILEKQLSGTRRWVCLGSAIVGLASAVLFATLAVIMPADFPWPGRIIFVVGALFGIGWASLGLKVFRRGSINLKSDTAAANAMTWVFVVLMVTLFMVFAPNNIVGLRMILISLVFLVGGVAFLIRHVIEQSELKTRKKLLEIEYGMAELADYVKPERPSPPPSQT